MIHDVPLHTPRTCASRSAASRRPVRVLSAASVLTGGHISRGPYQATGSRRCDGGRQLGFGLRDLLTLQGSSSARVRSAQRQAMAGPFCLVRSRSTIAASNRPAIGHFKLAPVSFSSSIPVNIAGPITSRGRDHNACTARRPWAARRLPRWE